MNYAAIYITGKVVPTTVALASQAKAVLEYANGYYFNADAASPEVRKYFKENMVNILVDVQREMQNVGI